MSAGLLRGIVKLFRKQKQMQDITQESWINMVLDIGIIHTIIL